MIVAKVLTSLNNIDNVAQNSAENFQIYFSEIWQMPNGFFPFQNLEQPR